MKAVFLGVIALVLASPVMSYPGEERFVSADARKKYSAGNYEESAKLYEKAAEVAPNEAAIRFGLGSARYKAGVSEKALEAFRSVYDEANPLLTAAARFNAGVVEHENALTPIKDLLSRDATQPITDAAEREKAEKGVKELEAAAEDYREAMLRDPADNDMKYNYEVALRQIEHLKKLTEPPPQSDQSQQQNQQDQQNQQQNPQQQDQQNKEQNQQQDQEQQDEQKNDKNQGDQKQQPEPQSSPQQAPDSKDGDEQKQQDQQDSGKGKQDDKKQQPEDKKQDQPDQGDPKEGEEPGQPEKQDDKQSGSPGQQSKAPAGQGGEQKQPPPSPGEMSPQDVERLLNALPEEDGAVLQRLFNARYQTRSDMERDW